MEIGRWVGDLEAGLPIWAGSGWPTRPNLLEHGAVTFWGGVVLFEEALPEVPLEIADVLLNEAEPAETGAHELARCRRVSFQQRVHEACDDLLSV